MKNKMYNKVQITENMKQRISAVGVSGNNGK